MGFLAPHAEKIYALFRIMAGLLMAEHGFQKVFGWFGGIPEGMMPAPMLYGLGSIELIPSLLVAIGLFAGPAAFLLSGTMAAAFFIGHVFSDRNTTGTIVPLVNGGELAALYCFAFLFIAAKGSGIWSVDAARGGK
jgi:putative oxidoreductase